LRGNQDLGHEKWIWSEHLEFRMSKRKISRELAEETINNPDEIDSVELNRLAYQKVFGSKLVRVIAEENTLVNVYITSKIKKYLKGK
jgi:hypothetical protein